MRRRPRNKKTRNYGAPGRPHLACPLGGVVAHVGEEGPVRGAQAAEGRPAHRTVVLRLGRGEGGGGGACAILDDPVGERVQAPPAAKQATIQPGPWTLANPLPLGPIEPV